MASRGVPLNKEGILHALRGGDRRSIGRSNQVVAVIRRQPVLFPALIDGMHHADELVRMRAADAAEKLTVANPEWLQPFKVRLMRLAAKEKQQEVRWHLAQMLPRLDLSTSERKLVVTTLRNYLEDESRIVKTFAMQGLVDVVKQDPRLVKSIRGLISTLTRMGSPSMKSRGRKLLLELHAIRLSRPAPVSR